MINQLFIKIIPKDLLEKILLCFNLKSLNDSKFFTKYDLELNNTKYQLMELATELKQYYLPCKARVYLNNITTKRCITILRQIVKLHSYRIISAEKYVSKKKQITYRLIPKNKDKHPSIINHKNLVITFD